jgi:hypothetical protein
LDRISWSMSAISISILGKKGYAGCHGINRSWKVKTFSDPVKFKNFALSTGFDSNFIDVSMRKTWKLGEK